MAGIYIHIPFCKKKCNYCDFYSIIDTELLTDYCHSLLKEIELQKDFFASSETIQTIYFGGGTPSLISCHTINKIVDKISELFSLAYDLEITLEANPDDLSLNYLKQLSYKTPINRLSIGVQSFIDNELQFLNRRHNSQQSINCIENAIKYGFNNLSIDLIYGIPNSSLDNLKSNIRQILTFPVKHISAYHLTIENDTPFGKMLLENKLKEINESDSRTQFLYLHEELTQHNFIHYELSNFSKKNFASKHNTSYWKGNSYLGVGAAAHSFRKNCRQWNIGSVKTYIEEISKNNIPSQKETLSLTNRFNEYIMTGLRTFSGINLDEIKSKFGDKFAYHCIETIKKTKPELIKFNENKLQLSIEGMFVSNMIIETFFVVE